MFPVCGREPGGHGMGKRRVVITGGGAVSPLGRGVPAMFAGLKEGRTGVRRAACLEEVKGLSARLAGLVTDVDVKEVPRPLRRSMSAMSVYAYLAALEALESAAFELTGENRERLGVCIGSTVGSPHTMEDFFAAYLPDKSVESMKSMLFFRIMGHTAAANTAQALGLTGRILAPSAACASGLLAVGTAYESIAAGREEAVLCGGADEFHPLTAATFDVLGAHSPCLDPEGSPRPFDAARDGVVCAEGAGVLLLESHDSALRRGAPILAEVAGFHAGSDSSSIANPDPLPVYVCMKKALEDAGVEPGQADYVNAHATGTRLGDPAEAAAIARLFGSGVPVSSLKGHLGHTMAASGSIELAACLAMMREGLLIPTSNLSDPDPACAEAGHFQSVRKKTVRIVVKNSFALGGVACSLVIKGTQ